MGLDEFDMKMANLSFRLLSWTLSDNDVSVMDQEELSCVLLYSFRSKYFPHSILEHHAFQRRFWETLEQALKYIVLLDNFTFSLVYLDDLELSK